MSYLETAAVDFVRSMQKHKGTARTAFIITWLVVACIVFYGWLQTVKFAFNSTVEFGTDAKNSKYSIVISDMGYKSVKAEVVLSFLWLLVSFGFVFWFLIKLD